MLADQLGISNFPKSYFQKKKQKQKQKSVPHKSFAVFVLHFQWALA